MVWLPNVMSSRWYPGRSSYAMILAVRAPSTVISLVTPLSCTVLTALSAVRPPLAVTMASTMRSPLVLGGRGRLGAGALRAAGAFRLAAGALRSAGLVRFVGACLRAAGALRLVGLVFLARTCPGATAHMATMASQDTARLLMNSRSFCLLCGWSASTGMRVYHTPSDLFVWRRVSCSCNDLMFVLFCLASLTKVGARHRFVERKNDTAIDWFVWFFHHKRIQELGMSQVQVQGGNGKIRGGRGFSKKELEAAGVSLKQLKAEGLGYDSRRRTCRDVNVAALKEAFSAE